MTKILQLLHSLTTGGAEILADRIGRHLAQNNEVFFACLDSVGELGERLRRDGFIVHELHRSGGVDVGCISRLAKFIKQNQISSVHAHQYTPFFYASAARLLAGNIPIIFTEHGRFHPDTPSRKRGLYNRLALRTNDQVIAVGHQVKHALILNEFIPASKIDVIYNGIPINACEDNQRQQMRDNVRSEFGIDTDTILLCQVARLDYLKDHLTSIRAIKHLEDKQIRLLIVGEGIERNAIEQEVRKLDLQEIVILAGLRNDIPNILAGADIMLLSSISEGIPLTLIEGMAAKLPIVSTDVGGIPEVITDKVNGLLVAPRNPLQMAKAIDALMEMPTERSKMGERGRCIAEEKFSESQMMQQYTQLFA